MSKNSLKPNKILLIIGAVFLIACELVSANNLLPAVFLDTSELNALIVLSSAVNCVMAVLIIVSCFVNKKIPLFPIAIFGLIAINYVIYPRPYFNVSILANIVLFVFGILYTVGVIKKKSRFLFIIPAALHFVGSTASLVIPLLNHLATFPATVVSRVFGLVSFVLIPLAFVFIKKEKE